MSRSVSLETIIYLIVALLAGWLRLAHLDQAPLNDAEAAAALSVTGSDFLPDQRGAPSAVYRVFTGAVFAVSGADEVAARWVPALAGVLLVFTPLLVRREIGPGAAVATACLFAISPTLWTASRTAGGASLGVLGLTAGGFFLMRARREPRLNLEMAGASGGLAAASGPIGFTGAATLAAGWLVLSALRRRRSKPGALSLPLPEQLAESSALRALAVAGLTMLAIGSGVGFAPDGLQVIFDGLGQWADSWAMRGGQPAGTVLLQLPAYEPLALVFGGIAVVSAFRKGRGLAPWFASWVVGGILLLLVYPGRQPQDVLWVVIPLTVLAAPMITGSLERVVHARPVWVTLGAGSGVLALLGFSYLQLRGYLASAVEPQVLLGVPALLGLALMGLLLAATALSLVAAGWSTDLALSVGGGVGLVILLTLSISAGAALNSAEPSASELWRPQTAAAGLLILRESLSTLSEAELGRPDALPIQVVAPPTPSLAWVLRGYPRYDGLSSEGAPPVILVGEEGAFPGQYLGQSLSIGEQRVWPGAYPPQLLAWWLTRSGPTADMRWVLLVRQDVAGVEQLQERPPSEQLQERPPSEQLQERPPSEQLEQPEQ